MAKKKRERKSYVSKKERREKAMIASHRDPRMDKPSERLLAVHLMVPTVPDILHTRLGKGCGRISASVPFKLAER